VPGALEQRGSRPRRGPGGRRRGGRRSRLAHEALERCDDGGRLLGRRGRRHDPKLRAAVHGPHINRTARRTTLRRPPGRADAGLRAAITIRDRWPETRVLVLSRFLVVAQMVGRERRDNPLERLTGREQQVLSLMDEGKSNHGIARDFEVSPAAIEKHITNLFIKLGLGHEPLQHRRVMAVLALLHAQH
jgi:DNA-binding CsgD family transcriptional regulator